MLLFTMKTIIKNDQYIITLNKEIIDDLTNLNKNLTHIKNNVKEIILDLRYVKYTNSIFVDYIDEYNSIVKDKNIVLKIINCSENIYNLIKKSKKNLDIEINLKDI